VARPCLSVCRIFHLAPTEAVLYGLGRPKGPKRPKGLAQPGFLHRPGFRPGVPQRDFSSKPSPHYFLPTLRPCPQGLLPVAFTLAPGPRPSQFYPRNFIPKVLMVSFPIPPSSKRKSLCTARILACQGHWQHEGLVTQWARHPPSSTPRDAIVLSAPLPPSLNLDPHCPPGPVQHACCVGRSPFVCFSPGSAKPGRQCIGLLHAKWSAIEDFPCVTFSPRAIRGQICGPYKLTCKLTGMGTI
jgi:hypothetical protein